MSITKIFFDSDAVIAGSASQQGASFILLQLSELGLIEGVISQKVVNECRKNIEQKLPDALTGFEQIISLSLNVVKGPSIKESEKYSKMAHKKDVLILAAAIKSNAQFLVTFNTKDFYPSPEIGLRIIEPGKLLKEIRHQLSKIVGE